MKTTNLLSGAMLFDLDGQRVTVIRYKGQPVWLASEVERSLGYSQGRISRMFREDWRLEAREGVDFMVVARDKLRDLKQAMAKSSVALPPKVSHLFLLTQKGLDLVIMRTSKPAGRAFRAKLRDEVFPALREKGWYALDAVEPALKATTNGGSRRSWDGVSTNGGSRRSLDSGQSLRWLYGELRELEAADTIVMAQLALHIAEKESGEDLSAYRAAVLGSDAHHRRLLIASTERPADFVDDEPTVERPETTAELARQTRPPGEGALERLQANVVAYLRQHGTSTWNALFEAIGARRYLMKAAIAGLLADGRLQDRGDGLIALESQPVA